MKRIKLGVLGSTRGSSLQAVIDAINANELAAEIKMIIANKQNAGILQRAKNHHIPARCILNDEKQMTECFKENSVELILLIGYMKILSKDFVNQWKNRILNIHPSLLPKHAGLMDLAVHQAVIDASDQETGCSVHYVEEEVDAGEVILQKKCNVVPEDTAETLKTKVQVLEGQALVEAIALMQSGFC